MNEPLPETGMVRNSELLAVLAFMVAVAIVLNVAVKALWRRYVRRSIPQLGRAARVMVAIAAFGLLCIAYGWLVEPRWVETTRTSIPCSRVSRPIRIAHLSDIHSDAAPLVEDRLPEIIAGLKPDVIVFTGDAANSREGLKVFRRCLTEVAKIAPTFAVKGNWEVMYPEEGGAFDGTGAVELDGDAAEVSVAGTTVRIVGAAFHHAQRLAAAVEALPADGPVIVLYHCPYPDLIPERLRPRVDLFCAGHVHGGQVALPFYGALLTLSKHGKRFERGLYPDADGLGLPLYVSRGIGMEGHWVPRVRFCSRPEVALLELVPKL